MHPIFPLEVFATIINYLSDDKRTLKDIAPVSHGFCKLAQKHIFSTILLRGRNLREPTRLGRLLKSERRGEILVQYIKKLIILDDDQWLYNCHSTGFRIIQFIYRNAVNLRSVHIGPLGDVVDWGQLSDSTQGLIMCLLRDAEDILLEGFKNVPLNLFEQMTAVRSLDLSMIDLEASPVHSLPHGLVPSVSNDCPALVLTSLALHTGMLAYCFEDEDGDEDGDERFELVDMADTFRVLQSQKLFDLSHLTTLYLLFLGSTGLYFYERLFFICKDTLESLRFFMYEEDPADRRYIIDLGSLPSLQSLYILINYKSDPAWWLANTLHTLEFDSTNLQELRLFIDNEWWEEEFPNPTPWHLLNVKLDEIAEACEGVKIMLHFPPTDESQMFYYISLISPGLADYVDQTCFKCDDYYERYSGV
ncbi:hypothetical protein AX17_001610 [Amanita inopinata Kibby_2008]|nr:hypothetical protein AX17_001610 [Amanita inopinata Kibby_2008]